MRKVRETCSEEVAASRMRVSKTPEKALQDLMRYAARAERSSGDALRLMRRWGIDETARQQILKKLQQQHFIDDERFAQAYVREKLHLAGWGIHKIRMGLRLKGIDKAIIERVLDFSAQDKQENEQRLSELLTRKRRSLKEDCVYKIKDKLIRYGMSRGYEYESVREVVAEILRDELNDAE